MKKSSSTIDRSASPLRVAAVGLRGIPDVEGGVESHVQNLYPLLADAGFEVSVHARQHFVPKDGSRRWRGVDVVPSWSPRTAGLEALVHSFLAILKARVRGVELLHIHAVGPALLTQLARLLGFWVVVTHHGRDYEREKWGPLAKVLLKAGEGFAAKYAHRVICVARNDAERLNRIYGSGTAVAIPNGAPRLALPAAPGVLKEFGLSTGRYVLNVARLVPEKRQLDLIAAFGRAAPAGWKLALVGSALNQSDYPASVQEAAHTVPGCVLCGNRGGAELATLYANAGVYALPSAHEGLPITLLEAMSFGLPCIASDIPANREVPLANRGFFPVGDVEKLADRLKSEICSATTSVAGIQSQLGQSLNLLPQEYRWETVAETTGRLLLEIAGRRAPTVASNAVP